MFYFAVCAWKSTATIHQRNVRQREIDPVFLIRQLAIPLGPATIWFSPFRIHELIIRIAILRVFFLLHCTCTWWLGDQERRSMMPQLRPSLVMLGQERDARCNGATERKWATRQCCS